MAGLDACLTPITTASVHLMEGDVCVTPDGGEVLLVSVG